MDIQHINIVDEILESRIALHDFGKPVNAKLEEVVAAISDPMLLVINLRKANPMDYEFVNISFNSTIKASMSNERIYLLFLIDTPEFEELCTGIIDILGLKLAEGELETDVLSKNGFSMAYQNEKGETKYLSSLDAQHLSVLELIDSEGPIDSAKIQSDFSLIAEEATSIITALKKSKFIHQIEGHQYVSIKSYLKSSK